MTADLFILGGNIINCRFDFTMVCCTWIGMLEGDGGSFVGVTFVNFAGLMILHNGLLLGDGDV